MSSVVSLVLNSALSLLILSFTVFIVTGVIEETLMLQKLAILYVHIMLEFFRLIGIMVSQTILVIIYASLHMP